MDSKRTRTAGRILAAAGLAALAALPGLWPLLVLALPGILIASMPPLTGRTADRNKPGSTDTQAGATGTSGPPEQPETDSGKEDYQKMLQQVTSLINKDFPGAAWAFESPHAQELFLKGEPLFLLLDHTGGYRRAKLQIAGRNALAIGYGPDRQGQGPGDGAEDSHSLLAFQWTRANREDLMQRLSAAAELGQGEILVPAPDLPCPESWRDICTEIDRTGIGPAAASADGIWILLPYQEQKGRNAA